MSANIQQFISIGRFKNGRLKIYHDVSNEASIYRFLYNLGFRQCEISGKRIYYRKVKDNLTPVSIAIIRNTFLKYLEQYDYRSLPSDISKNDVINWFLSKNPIRTNNKRLLLGPPPILVAGDT